MNTLTIKHASLSVIREIEKMARDKGASTHLSAVPSAPARSVVASAPMVTGATGGTVLSVQRSSPKVVHVDAPCACSGTYVLHVDGVVRQAVGDEMKGDTGLWNATKKAPENQPVKAGEFIKLTVAPTSETIDALIGAVHLGRDGSGKQAWMIQIEKVK